jgi:predicted enzyme related to lactoylglutathione lyase
MRMSAILRLVGRWEHRNMAETQLRITDVIIDSRDPEALAAFWSALLDRPIGVRIGPYVFLERADGPGVGFQRTDAPKTGKNRVHVDISSPDPTAEVARIEALGGRHLEEYAEGGFLVMADPEGNEFCLIPTTGCHLDDHGRAHYLPPSS